MHKNIRVIVLCGIWYLVSSLNNVIGKHVLNSYPHPMTLSFFQLVSITLFSIPLLSYLRLNNKLSTKQLKWVLPLSVAKFLALITAHFSIAMIPISYAHTVKATMPLFTVITTKLLLNEVYPLQVYLSLIPIVLGVSIATITEINFNAAGMIFALTSTFIFCLQTIYNKKLMKDGNLHQFELLYYLGKYSLMFYTPLYLLIDLNYEFTPLIILFLVLDGALAFLQNVLAFQFLKLVSPVSYSVANASKRIFIIAASLLFFGNKVTVLNLVGVVMAVGGVIGYSLVKNKAAVKKLELPKYYLNNNNYI